MTCSTCRFWRQTPKRKTFGLCRRRSPGVTEQGGTKWPQTFGNDSCGDYVPALGDLLRVVPEPPPFPPNVEQRKGRAERLALTSPAVALSEDVTLPGGWFTDLVARVMGIRCPHAKGFEVQLRVDGTARCPDCQEPQAKARPS